MSDEFLAAGKGIGHHSSNFHAVTLAPICAIVGQNCVGRAIPHGHPSNGRNRRKPRLKCRARPANIPPNFIHFFM
jgi:hypothetical protein